MERARRRRAACARQAVPQAQFLERAAVTPRSQRAYSDAVAVFHRWAPAAGSSVLSLTELDSLLARRLLRGRGDRRRT